MDMNKEQVKHAVGTIRVVSVGQFVTFGAGFFKGEPVKLLTVAGCAVAFFALEAYAHRLLAKYGG